uniref:Uncharacterized protein n=1 Tax=Arundo donax TaxID=35708 RepID=A0A0A9GHI2_ARUDO
MKRQACMHIILTQYSLWSGILDIPDQWLELAAGLKNGTSFFSVRRE